MVSVLYFAAGVTANNNIVNHVVPLLGAWSYTVYLIHADFGYFIRTQYYNRLLVWMPRLAGVVNEHIIMAVAVFSSLFLAYVILRFGNWIMQNADKGKRQKSFS